MTFKYLPFCNIRHFLRRRPTKIKQQHAIQATYIASNITPRLHLFQFQRVACSDICTHLPHKWAQWQSLVQTRLCCLHEHRPEHVRFSDAQRQRVNCKAACGAGAFLLTTGNSRPSCRCHTSSRCLGMTGTRTISCDQILACTCALRMCCNQVPRSLSTP